MSKRSWWSMLATIAWVFIWLTVGSTLSSGWIAGALQALAFIGAAVLWNIESIGDAWREDRAAKRRQETT